MIKLKNNHINTLIANSIKVSYMLLTIIIMEMLIIMGKKDKTTMIITIQKRIMKIFSKIKRK
jgi:hypothetical protein